MRYNCNLASVIHQKRENKGLMVYNRQPFIFSFLHFWYGAIGVGMANPIE